VKSKITENNKDSITIEEDNTRWYRTICTSYCRTHKNIINISRIVIQTILSLICLLSFLCAWRYLVWSRLVLYQHVIPSSSASLIIFHNFLFAVTCYGHGHVERAVFEFYIVRMTKYASGVPFKISYNFCIRVASVYKCFEESAKRTEGRRRLRKSIGHWWSNFRISNYSFVVCYLKNIAYKILYYM